MLGDGSFASNCLLARNLLTAGVRQLFDWGWDIHGTGSNDDLVTQFPAKCRDVDQPIAALMADLKRTGLLEDTPGAASSAARRCSRPGAAWFFGRDHQPDAFSIGWPAKAGHVHGSTDDLGAAVHEDGVSVRDLQATVLHLLGFDAGACGSPSRAWTSA